jgi:hypothetical protein
MASLIPSIVHLSPPMDVSPVLAVRFSPLFEQSTAWEMSNIRAHKGYRAIYPFEPDDLDAIACFFEFDHAGNEKIPMYIEPLKQQVAIWKQQWKQKPPSLTAHEERGNKIVLYDDRPHRTQARVELTGAAAAAYAVCQDISAFQAVAARVRHPGVKNHLSDEELRRTLDGFVARKFMLREGDLYLSLATKPGRRMDVSESW